MTWPAKAVAGLFLTLSIASSCSDPSSIGLDLDPNNNQIGVFYAEIPLSASMVLLDSFNTTNAGVMVVGGLTSEFFGTTEGIGFSRLAISPTVARPQQNAVLDSVKFNFQIESVIGNDLSNPKTLSVHLLNEAILDTTYYNSDRLEFDAQPIAQGSFNFSTRQDTTVNVHMESGFSEFIFDELKKGDAFRDIFTFRNLIPGIAFQGDPSEEASTSIRVGSNTAIIVYYKNEGDTISRGYTISTAQSRHFNFVNNDRTGTPTAEITEPRVAYNVGNRVGSISNVGIVVKLDTSPIDNFLDTLQNVTFNDIELAIGPLSSNISTNRPPSGLMMYLTDAQNRILRNSNNNSLSVQREGVAQVVTENGSVSPAFSNPAFLTYGSTANTYRVKITSHMNALYRLGLERNDFLLYPSVGQAESGDIFKRSFREFVVNQDDIKLKIYYSKIRAF
ncbi:DUF4270 domain-containing protein [Belliella kenyensis]|uniref:DUF4270 domain-containing protein n=1 Tax=Belliella kenyensis TaxID=1472724 RepID=A0ABV8EJA1_9BACT|nr:DUF4270 domain-containing protein [Belliella kenyensis]MCH7403324.1 DUF4270 domain-containing protein [Belliella kenyensis]MDN3602965.1 DUF4270 domain-containing protein [Belliella kenyensis]